MNLYWTEIRLQPTLRGMTCLHPFSAVQRPPKALLSLARTAGRAAAHWPRASVLALLCMAGGAGAAQPQALDVVQARAEVSAGTVVWDLRGGGAVLPGALRVDPQALAAWRATGDLAVLSAAVSAAGVNLSGRVLLVADADDAATAHTAARLARLARGSIAWLQGGVSAWQAQGLPLEAVPATRLPLPQRLVALDAQPSGDAPADAARRRTATFAMYDPAIVAQRVEPGALAPR